MATPIAMRLNRQQRRKQSAQCSKHPAKPRIVKQSLRANLKTVAALGTAAILFCGLFYAAGAKAASAPAMMTPGSFNVSPSGASTYTIPIVVPPGTAGMVPQLSLNYSSQGGDGIVGWGWSLSGLPSIGRCPRTIAQDGVVGSVNYDNNDRFCLDGERLIAVSGTYGAHGTNYRTERDNFSWITSLDQTGNGPTYFKIWTKAGQVLELGNTTDSRAVTNSSPTSVRIWAVNKVRDSSGNYFTVTYNDGAPDTLEGQIYPTRIDYTGNTGLTPYNSVRFTYNTNRPDQFFVYHAGSRLRTKVRLTNVKTYADNTLVSDYQLTYNTDASATKHSRVESIRLCDGGATQACMPATTFTWWGTRDTLNMPQGAGPYVSPFLFDYNGDGLIDSLTIPDLADSTADAYIGNPDGTFTTTTLNMNGWSAACAQTTNCLTTEGDYWYFSWHAPVGAVGDLDGDGYADLTIKQDIDYCYWDGESSYLCNYSLTESATFRNNRAGGFTFLNYGAWYILGPTGDFNGDGRTDVAIINQGTTPRRLQAHLSNGDGTFSLPSYINLASNAALYVADFDGNGCSDVLTQSASEHNIYYYCNAAQYSGNFDNQAGWTLVLGDYNGDGKADLMRSAAGWGAVYLSSGAGFSTTIWDVPPGWVDTNHLLRTGDFNADGKTDIARISMIASDSHKIYLSRGYGVASTALFPCDGSGNCTANYTIANSSIHYTAQVADYNSDGVDDLRLDNFSPYISTYTPEYISALNNGLGIDTNIVYDRINKGTLYTRNTDATYPKRDVVTPSYVVAGVRADNGIVDCMPTNPWPGSNCYESTYQYEGLKIQQDGRGFLGFLKVIVTDRQTNVVQTTVYEQSFPKIGLVASETKVIGTTTLNSTTNIFDFKAHSGTYYVYMTQTVATSRDLNNAVMPDVTTTFTYDCSSAGSNYRDVCYGNATQVVVKTGPVATPTSTKTTTNTYTNDTANWFIGRLQTATQTNQIPNASATRTSSFTYYDTTGLLKDEIVEPGASPYTLQTHYEYDAFGNKTQITVSGDDITTRNVVTNAYDSRGRFATTVTNALGQSETRSFSGFGGAEFGLPTSQTGPNSLTTTWTYDKFGRKTLETRPDGTTSSYSYYWCTCTNVPGAFFYVVEACSCAAPSNYTYFDGLSRQMAYVTQGFAAEWIVRKVEYDAKGRQYRSSGFHDFYSGTPKWTTSTFDPLGRVTEVRDPSNFLLVENGYNGKTTTVTRHPASGVNQTTTTVKNDLGEVISVTDANGKTTNYAYDPFGNQILITDCTNCSSGIGNNETEHVYNIRGHRTDTDDPDLGHWVYVPNVLGEVTSQTDAKGQTTTFTYDLLGRVIARVEPGCGYAWCSSLYKTWEYGTSVANHNVGQLVRSRTCTVSGCTGGVAFGDREYTYDSIGRLSTSSVVRGSTYTYTTTYNSDGRVDTITYPSGFVAKYAYTGLGYLSQLKNNADASVLWTANAMDLELHLTQQTLGNGVVINRSFDYYSGAISTIQAGPSSSIANFGYTFDKIGNLTQRVDNIAGGTALTEKFCYDPLNRLTDYSTSATSCSTAGSKHIDYDETGNIKYKTDVGTYTYPSGGGVRPHAVSSIAGSLNTSYTYDNNGNLLSGGGRAVTWTPANVVATITRGSNTQCFQYYAEGDRVEMELWTGMCGQAGSSFVQQTHYFSGPGVKSERVESGATVTWRDYLFAGGQMVGERISVVGGSTTFQYFVPDHLGSVAVVTNAAGGLQTNGRLSYDAWGNRRLTNGSDGTPAPAPTTRGFTGHEMIDSVGLVNMNGRVYDSYIGKFMSADPVTETVFMMQVLNKYSYVGNNPLSYTDMTGYSYLNLRPKGPFGPGQDPSRCYQWHGCATGDQDLFFTIVKTVAIIGASFGCGPGAPACAAAASGGTAAAIAGLEGGDIGDMAKAFVFTAVQSAAAAGVGAGLKDLGFAGTLSEMGFEGAAATVVAHGAVGGLFSVAGGGNFASGFVSAGFGALGGPAFGADFSGGGLVASAVLGGTASAIAGGKFANGAITASFAYLASSAAQAASELAGGPSPAPSGAVSPNAPGGTWVNPTGQGVRGTDAFGSGSFGATRRTPGGVVSSHMGTDYVSTPGQDVVAVTDGVVVRVGYAYGSGVGAAGTPGAYQHVEIMTTSGYIVRELYVAPSVRPGPITAGTVIGTAQSLQPRYPGITNHVHVQISGPGGFVDPTRVIP